MLFEAMHKVAGMPLNEEMNWGNVDRENSTPTPEQGKQEYTWQDNITDKLEELRTNFYKEQDRLLKIAADTILNNIDRQTLSQEDGQQQWDYMLGNIVPAEKAKLTQQYGMQLT